MAQETLLSIVQSILNDIGGDEVNSINDTVEAEQIANIAKSVYYEIINSREWPHLKKWINLDSTSSSTPSHLRIPTDVQKVLEVKYDTRAGASDAKRYTTITYLPPEDFMAHIDARDSTASTIDTVTDFDGTELFIKNDTAPTYYTSFDNEYLVFDSYGDAGESTLQSAKSKVYVYEEPTFSVTDTYVVDLPDKEFPHFKAELRSIAWIDVAASPNQKAEQRARKQHIWSAQEKFRVNGGITFPENWGRRR